MLVLLACITQMKTDYCIRTTESMPKCLTDAKKEIKYFNEIEGSDSMISIEIANTLDIPVTLTDASNSYTIFGNINSLLILEESFSFEGRLSLTNLILYIESRRRVTQTINIETFDLANVTVLFDNQTKVNLYSNYLGSDLYSLCNFSSVTSNNAILYSTDINELTGTISLYFSHQLNTKGNFKLLLMDVALETTFEYSRISFSNNGSTILQCHCSTESSIEIYADKSQLDFYTSEKIDQQFQSSVIVLADNNSIFYFHKYPNIMVYPFTEFQIRVMNSSIFIDNYPYIDLRVSGNSSLTFLSQMSFLGDLSITNDTNLFINAPDSSVISFENVYFNDSFSFLTNHEKQIFECESFHSNMGICNDELGIWRVRDNATIYLGHLVFYSLILDNPLSVVFDISDEIPVTIIEEFTCANESIVCMALCINILKNDTSYLQKEKVILNLKAPYANISLTAFYITNSLTEGIVATSYLDENNPAVQKFIHYENEIKLGIKILYDLSTINSYFCVGSNTCSGQFKVMNESNWDIWQQNITPATNNLIFNFQKDYDSLPLSIKNIPDNITVNIFTKNNNKFLLELDNISSVIINKAAPLFVNNTVKNIKSLSILRAIIDKNVKIHCENIGKITLMPSYVDNFQISDANVNIMIYSIFNVKITYTTYGWLFQSEDSQNYEVHNYQNNTYSLNLVSHIAITIDCEETGNNSFFPLNINSKITLYLYIMDSFNQYLGSNILTFSGLRNAYIYTNVNILPISITNISQINFQQYDESLFSASSLIIANPVFASETILYSTLPIPIFIENPVFEGEISSLFCQDIGSDLYLINPTFRSDQQQIHNCNIQGTTAFEKGYIIYSAVNMDNSILYINGGNSTSIFILPDITRTTPPSKIILKESVNYENLISIPITYDQSTWTSHIQYENTSIIAKTYSIDGYISVEISQGIVKNNDSNKYSEMIKYSLIFGGIILVIIIVLIIINCCRNKKIVYESSSLNKNLI